MKTRQLLVLCLVVMIGLAGCSGISPLGGDTETDTNQTDTADNTSDEADVSYPAGYDETGITDPETAADQHNQALSEYDTYARNLTLGDEASQTEINTASMIDGAEQRGTSETTAIRDGTLAIEENQYHEDGVTYEKSSIVDTDLYNSTEEPFSSFEANNSNTSNIEKMLENVSVESAGTVTRGGDTLYQYNATGVDNAEPFVSTVQPVEIDAVESFNATLLVDEEGIIRQFESTTTYTEAGERWNATVAVQFTDVGSTSVEEPDWLENAK